MSIHRPRGVGYALLAALLFGASAPASKALLGEISPVLLAGLLYAGAGFGMSLGRARRGRETPRAITPQEQRALAGAIVAGGVLAPVLLLLGMQQLPGSSASLLLNLEGVFTALLAWRIFRENVDRSLVLGMFLVVGAGALLSWEGEGLRWSWGALWVGLACLAWGLDNNLTQRASGLDPARLVAWKGLCAGAVNTSLGLLLSPAWPGLGLVLAALGVGFLSYGASLWCYVAALRHLGAARTGAYFALGPFVGAVLSLAFLGESPARYFWPALAIMGAGLWLHLRERHEHEHTHEPLTHAHRHRHDGHHQHGHGESIDPNLEHEHEHTHEPLTHAHRHFPDLHHRHTHAA
jgi:drug/metabolite transporter (DMT)-like permease